MTAEEIKELKASFKQKAKQKLKFVKELYKTLLKNGWTLNEIDEMDIHFYLELYNEKEETVYIDEIRII